MDMETRRVAVKGLRGADAATLRVLTQDVIQLPLNQIESSTLCDLFALSEIEEGMPADLGRDLLAFRERRTREMNDLLEGEQLSTFMQSLVGVNAELIPASLRVVVEALSADRETEDGAIDALADHLQKGEPTEVLMSKTEGDAPSAAETAASKRTPAKAPRRAKTSKTAKDPAREEWMEEYAISRLVNYENGLKEAILVAGTRHKAPWDDVTEKEVRAVLRRMARESKLRTSAGRWMIDR